MVRKTSWLCGGLLALSVAFPAQAFDNPLDRGALADFLTLFREEAIPSSRSLSGGIPNIRRGRSLFSTKERRLITALGGGRAIEYGVGVGREGFTWSGTKTISRKHEWPDWRPPPQMLRGVPSYHDTWPAGWRSSRRTRALSWLQ